MIVHPRSSQRGVAVLAVLLIVIIVVVAIALVLAGVSAMRVKSARLAWEDTFGAWDEIMQRFPATAANTSALEIERIAASLGVNIVPRHVERYGAIEEDLELPSPAFARLKKEVFGLYASPQLERARRGAIDTPPAALTEFMNDHASELASLRRALISGSVPVWESDLSKLWEAPIPNLLGHIDLAKLLTEIAVARLQAGDVEGALENVEASIALTRSLRDAPYLICQLIAIAEARMQVGVLRMIPDLPKTWVDRIEEHDYRESFLTAMKYEGWVWAYTDEAAWTGSPQPWWAKVVSPVTAPYQKLCLADLSDAWRERLVNIEQVDALCDYDLSSVNATMEIPIPRWNVMGETMIPNLLNASDRLARLELDLELLRLVHEADAERRAAGGEWPSASNERRKSASCPQDHWLYSSDDGSLQIEFSREISWPGQRGVILPTSAILE